MILLLLTLTNEMVMIHKLTTQMKINKPTPHTGLENIFVTTKQNPLVR